MAGHSQKIIKLEWKAPVGTELGCQADRDPEGDSISYQTAPFGWEL
jgi:hypothetical protein